MNKNIVGVVGIAISLAAVMSVTRTSEWPVFKPVDSVSAETVVNIYSSNGFTFMFPRAWKAEERTGGERGDKVALFDEDGMEIGLVECSGYPSEFYEQETIASSSRMFTRGGAQYRISYMINDYVSYPNTNIRPNVFYAGIENRDTDKTVCAVHAQSEQLSDAQMRGLRLIYESWR